MSEQEERARKRKLVDALSSQKYGPRTLRELCVVALDIGKINAMSDADLLSIPGIGATSLRGVRYHLSQYYSED